MPCGDNSADSWRLADEQEHKARLDGMAQMLCFLCGEMIYGAGGEEAEKVFAKNPKLQGWWNNHMHCDYNRVVGEMVGLIEYGEKLGSAPTKEGVIAAFIEKAEEVHAVSMFHKTAFFPHCYEEALKFKRGVTDGQG